MASTHGMGNVARLTFWEKSPVVYRFVVGRVAVASVLFAMLLLPGTVTSGGEGDDAAKELMQGKWALISDTFNGKHYSDKSYYEGRFMVIGEKSLSFVSNEGETECTMRVDASTNPVSFSLENHEGLFANTTFYGICKFDKDELVICYGIFANYVASDFSSPSGEYIVLRRYRRVGESSR